VNIPLPVCLLSFFRYYSPLYLINSRNLSHGVYDEKVKGFIGIRTKYKYVYLFTEFHWDTGPPYGTAKPIKLLETCPLEDTTEGRTENKTYRGNDKLFQYLLAKQKEYPAEDLIGGFNKEPVDKETIELIKNFDEGG